MESHIYNIALLAAIDERLDELIEDYGDLPEQIKKKEAKLNDKKLLVNETETIVEEIRDFIKKAKRTLVELKDKEDKLTQQQFKVRNNKEFDAITNEINHLKTEHEKLADRMRTEGIKEENLMNILNQQTAEMNEAQKELDDKFEEVQRLAGDQDRELSSLREKRGTVLNTIPKKFISDYERIRIMHRDAAVLIRKNSCSGCFNAIPAQIIVEVRNNLNTLYFCESCGRLLVPEDCVIEFEEIA
ncbi:MAG: C4-type zinc ribbon domain-containing protein [Candidatus Kapabacteria bacterium]|nr:C4-type zinc ribbon domain-containing protein [Candidatus Kapabacteria bacterium]